VAIVIHAQILFLIPSCCNGNEFSQELILLMILRRFLARKDIGVTVALGCPSLDRKVVNSGKRLRAYVGIDEGNVSNDLVSTIICFCLCIHILYNFLLFYIRNMFFTFNQ